MRKGAAGSSGGTLVALLGVSSPLHISTDIRAPAALLSPPPRESPQKSRPERPKTRIYGYARQPLPRPRSPPERLQPRRPRYAFAGPGSSCVRGLLGASVAHTARSPLAHGESATTMPRCQLGRHACVSSNPAPGSVALLLFVPPASRRSPRRPPLHQGTASPPGLRNSQPGAVGGSRRRLGPRRGQILKAGPAEKWDVDHAVRFRAARSLARSVYQAGHSPVAYADGCSPCSR